MSVNFEYQFTVVYNPKIGVSSYEYYKDEPISLDDFFDLCHIFEITQFVKESKNNNGDK